LNLHIYRKRIVIIINAWLLLMSRFTLLSWFLFFFLHFYTTTRVNVYTFHILSSLFGLTKIYIRTDHISNIICRKLLMTVMTFDLDDIMHYFCRIFRRISNVRVYVDVEDLVIIDGTNYLKQLWPLIWMISFTIINYVIIELNLSFFIYREPNWKIIAISGEEKFGLRFSNYFCLIQNNWIMFWLIKTV